MAGTNKSLQRALELLVLFLATFAVKGFQPPKCVPSLVTKASLTGRVTTELAVSNQAPIPEPLESSNDSGRKTKKLSERIDDIGALMKMSAEESRQASRDCSVNAAKQKLYICKAGLFYTLFLIYRAYRGFFILLPAVFRQVYQLLELNAEKMAMEGSLGSGFGSASGTPSWRTRITMSTVASIVTVRYLLRGFCHTMEKFAYLRKSYGLGYSLTAISTLQEEKEEKLLRGIRNNHTINGLPAEDKK